MDKKKGNKHGRVNWAQRRKKAKARRGDDRNADYELKPIDMKNIKFDLYYRRLLDSILNSGDAKTEEEAKENKDKDFAAFCQKLKEKLPITFRINPLNVGVESVVDLFSSETFIKDWCEKNKDDPENQGKEGRIENMTSEELANLRFK